MLRSIERGLDSLLDHYATICIILALFVLSLVGVGNVVVVCLLGLLLCLAGLAQPCAKLDLWVLLPLLVYDAACLASSCAALGGIIGGYGVTHGIFPVVYLLAACLEDGDRRMLKLACVLWTVAAGTASIFRSVHRAVVRGWAGRMGGIFGNPNAMGIFLVLGWFAVMYVVQGRKAEKLSNLEPPLLIGAAMTLSMGSFVAMAVGVITLLVGKKQTASWRDTARYACRVLAKASLGMGTGLLIYLAGAWSNIPWLTLPLAAYGVALTVLWGRFERFLEAKPKMAALIAGVGVLVAAAAVAVRPSALDTFAERLEMMASGLRYLTANPLLGVGPFQWRMLDMNDGGTYFNTWHIHNVVLHVGVEMGWIAMAALVIVAVRVVGKRASPEGRALAAAFLTHNMIDTSFFYLGITALALAAAGGFREGPRKLGGGTVKLIFGLLATLFASGLFEYVMTR